MCSGCWEEMGFLQIDTPAVREAAKAVDLLYDYSAVGGALHIVVDDWNVEREHIEHCLANNLSQYEEQREIEIKVGNLFLALTKEERVSALALQDGLWK